MVIVLRMIKVFLRKPLITSHAQLSTGVWHVLFAKSAEVALSCGYV
jgi:hypothetical protein